MSGAGDGYDALRWDGLCVTLDASELRFDPPPGTAHNARIIWKRLEVAMRDALKEDDDIKTLYIAHKKACKGVSFGEVSKKCVELDGKLSRAIAAHVRETSNLPPPKKLPD